MDVKLDLERLKALSSDLLAIKAEFDSADDFSNTVADATGSDELHGSVTAFAHKWNEKRPQMADSVGKLQQKLQTITDNFTKLDNDLAAAMEKAAAEAAPTTASTHGRARTN